MPEICFSVLFNHNYSKNIPKLEKIYEDRFGKVKYILPFASNDSTSGMIPVYGSSYQFSGFFPQALPELYSEDIDYYIFIADDMLLNPKLTQNNIISLLGLTTHDSFIYSLSPISECSLLWEHTMPALTRFNTPTGVEFQKLIPSKLNIRLPSSVKENADRIRKISIDEVRKLIQLKYLKQIIKSYYFILVNRGRKIPYPLWGGYSDFLIIPKKSIKKFCHYCGIFAAMGIFAEVAIPTAMVLTCDNIVVMNETPYEALPFWFKNNDRNFKIDEMKSVSQIEQLFTDDLLFIHPVKLSGLSI